MDRVTDAPEAKAAIEMALFDLNAKALGVPVHRLLGGAVRQEISLNGWVGMVEPEEAAAIASDFAARGFPSVKVKVGNGVAADSARVAAVRAANPGLKIRIDANESLDAEASIALGRAIEKYDIALFEQPVARDDLDEMARVRRAIDIPIMADESVYRLESIIEIIRREAADIIKLKVMKQGGLLRTLQGIEICEAAKIKCVVGHGFGSTLHTLAELHLVAVCDNVLEGCEAVGPIKLADDVVVDRLSMARGTMAIPAGPGLGASLDPGKLQRYAANGPVDPESNSTRRH
jgi:muconate cycloisomerase